MPGLLRSLLDSFAGKAKRPVYSTTATSGSRYHAPQAAQALVKSGLRVREVRVTEVVRETADAVTLRLAPVSPEPLVYRAGQFLTFVVPIEGQELRRAYSLSSCWPEPPAVTIKRVPGGRVSGYLNDSVEAGAVLRVMGPSGDFTAEPVPGGRRSFVFIAGGSGITPIMGIISDLVRREPESDLTLLFGNRDVGTIIFGQRLEQLSRAHPRLRVLHVLDEAPAGGVIDVAAIGPLSGARVMSLLGAGGAARAAEEGRLYYVCGPEPMMDGAVAALLAAGVPLSRIRTERFTGPARRVEPRGSESHPITFSRSGRTVTAAPGQTVLEAGIAAGLPLSYSCGMGGCGACKVRVVRGTAEMDEPNCLSPAERAGGCVLACVARAASELEVEA